MKFARNCSRPALSGRNIQRERGDRESWLRMLAHKSLKRDIVNFSAANLIGGLVFGSIGFVAFVYGKRMNLWKPMFLGLGLMIYPYFVSDDKIMLAIGILGSGVLFFFRE